VDPPYRKEQQIRVGQRFTLIRAERALDGRPVVLKTVRPGPTAARSAELLRHEYELLRRLDIPGVARPLGLSTIAGVPILELADAGPTDLAARIGGRPLAVDEFFALALDIVAIVGELHGRGVIHRDICPENFVLGERPTLVDFETATTIPAFTPRAGVPGQLEATLAYIAPEQTGRMGHLVDRRADLYSLGATLYEMLTGAPPFRFADPLELVHAHVARPPHPPAIINPKVPTLLSSIVLKLLSKTPEWRYQTAAALAVDLQEAARQWRAHRTIRPFELGREDLPYGFSPRGQLYGREEQSKALERAIERTRAGGRELLLVTGPAGIGKSALVEQARTAAAGRARWLAGKCDMLQGIVPYAPIADALGEWAQTVMREPADVLAAVRDRVREAVARHGRILTETISSLEELLGEQPRLAEVGPVEAENRFRLVFSRFFRALVADDGPIVLFLDDVQWIDFASIKLLRALASDPELRSVLIVCAYRTEEVGPEHPFTKMIADLRAAAPVTRIELTALAPSAVVALLCDTLRVDPAEAAPLAEIIRRKTAGNPFFVQRFLAYLVQAGLLVHSADRARWTWNTPRIEAEEVADNVANFLARAIRTLPTATQAVLEAAACIGNRFDLGLLASVCDKPVDEVAATIWSPLQDGLLVAAPEGSRFTWTTAGPVELGSAVRPTYRFGHDRIQQAAYSLLGEAERRRLHLRVGHTLLETLPPSTSEDAICAIVDQLDRATDLLPEAERRRLAELNQRAGRRAYAAAAYASALGYFQTGLTVLPRAPDSHDLWFALQASTAECAALAGEYDRCERLVDEGLAGTESPLEKATLYRIVVQSNATRGAHADAIRRGREGLRLLGLELPEEASAAAVRVERERARVALSARSEQELLAASPMDDPLGRAALGLLVTLTSTWFTAPMLFQIVSFRAAELTARRGLTPESPLAYAFHAIALAMDGEYQEAYTVGSLAVRLAARTGDHLQESRTLMCFGGHVSPWRAPIQDSVPLLRRSYTLGLESGELEFAAYAAANTLFALLIGGAPLDQLAAEADAAITFYRKIGHLSGLAYVLPIRQAARCLRGLTRDCGGFDDVEFDEARYLADSAGNGLGLAIFHLVRLETCLLLGELDVARAHEARARQWLPFLRTIACQVDYFFHASLLLAAQLEQAPPTARAAALLELRAHAHRLEVWAGHCPANFRHKHQLIAAELSRLEGRPQEALALYQAAIEDARRVGFVQDEAIAHERCARFLRAQADDATAATHLAAAADGYARWGATAKVRQLAGEPPAQKTAARVVAAGGEAWATLDLRSLLKAAETLVAELVPERLIEKMLRICTEAAAAERAVLVLQQQELVVRAVAAATGEVMLEQTPLGPASPLPLSIVEHVLRSGEALVLRDAVHEDPFAGDPYVRAHEVRSVLSLPIRRADRTLGALYFENRLATGAFTETRVEVLRLLVAPISIALENSQLFEERRRAEASLRLLAGASEVLGELLDYGAVLARAVALVVPALADWCIIDLLEDGVLRPAAAGHVDPRKVALAEALHRDHPVTIDSPQPQAQALRSGKPLLVGDFTEDAIDTTIHDEEHRRRVRELEPRSVMALPSIARGRVIGVFTFAHSQSRRRYRGPDLDLATEMVRRIAMAIDNARLHRSLDEESRRALFLSDAARLLASMDIDRALDGVARLAVPYLGDGCAIDIFGDKEPRRSLALARSDGRPPPPEVHRTVLAGHPAIYRVGSTSHLGVPLTVKAGLVGALTLSAPPHRVYSQTDLELAEELAKRCALALENARLYRHVQEALRARDEFLSIAAHEIRGPSHTIHLAVQTLQRGKVPAEAQARMFEVIERADRRLAQFVDELLDLGRIRAGPLQFVCEQVDLGAVVREVATTLRPELARAGSSLSITTAGESVGCWDRFRLAQVVHNLLANAIKFGLGKPIEVSIRAADGRTRLVVTDHGMGIPADMHERIFDPFERVISVRNYGGLGLGLYIARTIVAAMGGSITLASEPGLGATFTVELPLERPT
jgi:predicted ATPase/signal transduction histidine kinase